MNMLVRIAARMSLVLASLIVSVAALGADARFIVMMDSSASFQKAANATFVKQSNGTMVARANGFLGTSVRPQAVLRTLKMFVVAGDESQAIALRAKPGVALVEKERFFKAPRPVPMYGTFSPFNVTPIARPTNTTPAMPWGIKAVRAPEAWAASTRGEGARVLVLDTGLDKDHPAIPASRVEEGRDFVGDNLSPYPYLDQVGHGTHVAGTILAESMDTGFVGVAPKATLLAGRVCNTDGCSTLSIIAGINWGIEKKVGVINMSLGGPFPSSAQKRAVEAADAANIVVVAASGNDGNGSVGYPAGFPTVIAVGAVDVNLNKADFSQWGPELDVVAPGVDVVSSVPVGTGRETAVQITVNGKTELTPSAGMVGSPEMPNGMTNSLVFCGLGKADQFPTSVKGKFALISRGEITFAEKVKNAIAAGAAGAVIYNNAPGLLSGSLSEDGSEVAVPAVMITQVTGNALKAVLETNGAAEATIQSFRTDYASFQGTSMASPHTAGVVALIRSANENLTPAQVREILMTTTSPLQGPNDENQWGKGLVNAEAAVQKAASMR
ncbi:MAG: S8 family serine peptidase [Pseudobdellovibrionaceae bacterium]